MAKILFSIALKISPEQEQSLSQLFYFLKKNGHKISLIGERGTTNILSEFVLRKPYLTKGIFNKLKNFFLYLRLFYFSSFDHYKWMKRHEIWTRNHIGKKKLNSAYRNSFKSSVYILNNILPEYFFCWNPLGFSYGLMYDMSTYLGIKRKTIESGILPKSIFFDNKGMTAISELNDIKITDLRKSSNFDNYVKYGEQVFKNLKTENNSLYEQALITEDVKELLEDKKNKIKILLLGVSEVANGIIPYDHKERKIYLPFFSSNIKLLTYISSNMTDAYVVYKPHPAFESNKQNILISDNSSILHIEPQTLIEWANVVICTGTKLELNVLLNRKPLVLCGTGLLFNKQCAYEAHSKQNLINIINEAYLNEQIEDHQQNLIIYLGFLYLQKLLLPDSNNIYNKNENFFFTSFSDLYLN